jgi:hypothetical protein
MHSLSAGENILCLPRVLCRSVSNRQCSDRHLKQPHYVVGTHTTRNLQLQHRQTYTLGWFRTYGYCRANTCDLKISSLTLVYLQLDAQNSYLFTYNTFIKLLCMFLALPCSSSGGLRRNCIYAASGIVTVCRWLSCAPVKKELLFFRNRCTRPAESDDTRDCICTVTTWTSWRWAG